MKTHRIKVVLAFVIVTLVIFAGIRSKAQTTNPVLTLQRDVFEPDLARMFWPTGATGFALEYATNLSATNAWLPAQLPITTVNGMKSVEIDTTGGDTYYRLRQPGNLSITELSFDQTNVIQQCESLFLTATAFSGTNSALGYIWRMLTNPPGATFSLSSSSNTATFSSSTVGSYTLRVAVTNAVGQSNGFIFPVTVVPGLLCNLQPGTNVLSSVSVSASNVIGAPFPHFDIVPMEERNDEDIPRVPNGPLRGNLQPGGGPVSVMLRTNIPTIRPRNTNDPVVFGVNRSYGTNVVFSGVPPDMSGADGGTNVVLTSGNTWAALSIDGGVNFTALDPTTIFPSAPSLDAMGNQIDGGLCCDQIILYVPSIDRFIWLMQFWRANGNGPNMLRIASASPQTIRNSSGTAWTYWDLRSATFGMGNNWMDYPDMSWGNNFLYISVDQVGAGLLVARIPLSQIQASGNINIDYTNPANSALAYGSHLTQTTADEVFWAGHVSTSKMRIWNLREGSSTYSWRDVDINSWPNGSRTSLTPSGVNWLNFNFPGWACIGAARRFPSGSPSEIWFAWTAGQGGGFAHPHIQIVRLDASSFTLLEQMQVWNGSYAYAYPSLAANAQAEMGMALGFGGGNTYEASSAVGIWGDSVVWTPGLSTSSINRWGDFLTVRNSYSRYGAYAASIYNRIDLGGGRGQGFNPVYIRFGRQSLAP